jgi:hypothetical protein
VINQKQETDQMALQINNTTLMPAMRRQAMRISAAERMIMPSMEASTILVSCGEWG